MDVRILGISTALLCSAYAMPTTPAHVDFRGVISGAVVANDENTPPFAALEAMNLYIESEQPAEIENLLMVHNQLESGTRFGSTVGGDEPRLLAGLVIDSSKRSNQLSETVAQIDLDPVEVQPTVYQIAEVLVEEELTERTAINSAVRKIPTKNGAITVAKAGAIIPPVRHVVAANDRHIGNHKPTSLITGAAIMNGSVTGASIEGSVTMRDGAALTGYGDELVVYLNQDGRMNAVTEAHSADGSFKLDVSLLKGELVAEIRSRRGEILGRGMRRLDAIPDGIKATGIIKDLTIDVYPFYDGLKGSVVSAASIGGKNLYVKGAKIHLPDIGRDLAYDPESRSFKDGTISTGSTALVMGYQGNFWPSLSIQKSGLDFNIRLFSHSLIRALKNLMNGNYESGGMENSGLIWGRIAVNDDPVEGAAVSIVGEEEYKPVFFNGYIPDRLAKVTTSSGEFAFLNVKPGEHMLALNVAGKAYWPAMLPIEGKTVTHIDLTLQPFRNSEFVVFDALTGSPLPANIHPLGADHEYAVNESGEALYQVPSHNGLSFLEAESLTEYQPARVAVTGAPGEILFPLLKKDWLRNILKVTDPQEVVSGSVVGFVLEEDFNVILGATSNEENVKLVYFDAHGAEMLSGGPSGGGFVLSGLTPGMHTITILSKQSSRIHSQVVYVDQFATQIIRVSKTF